MRDYAHEWTDKELEQLEKRIAGEYAKARDDLSKTVTDYFSSFDKRDEEMKKMIGQTVNGREWTERDYKQWRLNQIGRGKRFEAMRDKMAERYTNANEVVAAYINDKTPEIYSLNRNYSAYTIDNELQQIGENANMYGDWTMFDEGTVRRLLVENPQLMPNYPEARAVERGIDLAYGQERIGAAVTSGILRGQSVYGIADELQQHIMKNERTAAIRAARTAVTSAQNAGRMDNIEEAEKMGIQVERTWMATLDGRTRHEHRMADGQRQPTDKPFNVGGYKMMFPGDPSAPGFLVYNCRCTLLPTPKGFNMREAKRWSRNPQTGEREKVQYQTYRQWYKEKTGIDINSLQSTTLPPIIKLKDIVMGHSIGAKARDVNVMDLQTGEMFKIAEGTHIKNVEVFAGYGVKKEFRKADKYAAKYGGSPQMWQHAKGYATLETDDDQREAEIHWVQCSGIGRFEHFVKRWLDE